MTDLPTFALDIESVANDDGWDQPPTLVIAGNDGSLGAARLPAVGTLEHLPPLPAGAAAVGFVSECWSYPQPLLDEVMSDAGAEALYRRQPPSRHPQRVEMRMAVVVAADGRSCCVSRVRGQPPELLDDGRIDGRVPRQLARLIGAL